MWHAGRTPASFEVRVMGVVRGFARRGAVRFRCMCACVVVLLFASPGRAVESRDQAFEPSAPNTIPTVFNQLLWAQTFTVGVSGTMTGVDVLVAQMFGVQASDLQVT